MVDRLLRSGTVFALVGVVGYYLRPDIGHIAFVAPLALPLLAYCTTRVTRAWHTGFRIAAAAVSILACLLPLLAYSFLVDSILNTSMTRTPRGNAAFVGSASIGAKMIDHVAALPPGGGFFFYPMTPSLPFITGRHDVAKYDIFQPDYTTPAQYQSACRSVVQRAEWLVIDWYQAQPDVEKRDFPATRNPQPREKVLFESALRKAFKVAGRDAQYELRQRLPDIDDSVCNGIASQQ